MQIAIIGLGKMGYNLALNLHGKKFNVLGYDIFEEARKRLAADGPTTADSLEALAKKFTERKVIWLMVPSGQIVDDTIAFFAAFEGMEAGFRDRASHGETIPKLTRRFNRSWRAAREKEVRLHLSGMEPSIGAGGAVRPSARPAEHATPASKFWFSCSRQKQPRCLNCLLTGEWATGLDTGAKLSIWHGTVVG